MFTLYTTLENISIEHNANETPLEVFYRAGLPTQGFVLLDKNNTYFPLTKVIGDEDLHAFSIRNIDFSVIRPNFKVIEQNDAVVELFDIRDNERTILQMTRLESIEFIKTSVYSVLNNYKDQPDANQKIQIALSPGGDGRILAECVSNYNRDYPGVFDFYCVICAVGFENEAEHIENAVELAQRFSFKYIVYDSEEGGKLLGYKKGLDILSQEFLEKFPNDEPEIMLTYWVQEVNFKSAIVNGTNAIIFGYNMEDVLGEILYDMMTGVVNKPYPIRLDKGLKLIAPLYNVPKKVLDSLDISNSLRNYAQRIKPVATTRSIFYLLSYFMIEQYPQLANSIVNRKEEVQLSKNEIVKWLNKL